VLIVTAAGVSTLCGAGKRPSAGEPVTVSGKLIDLQSYMTGKTPGSDPVKSAQQCIRSGVPAALETEEGLIVIGMGERGPSRLLVPLVLQHVELKGKLYEKDGLQYIDIASARAVREELEEEEHLDAAESEGVIEPVAEEEAVELETDAPEDEQEP
jgi:hypothetical protein